SASSGNYVVRVDVVTMHFRKKIGGRYERIEYVGQIKQVHLRWPPASELQRSAIAAGADRFGFGEAITMVTVYYDPSYAAAAYAFPTTRKARWIAESLQTTPI